MPSGDERDRLLAAAFEVLERGGSCGFSVDSVLKVAGLSTRSFYRHFGKKTELLMALLEMQMAGTTAWLRRRAASACSPPEKVKACIAAILDMAYMEEFANPISLFFAHWREFALEYPEKIERCTDAMIAPLAEAISLGRASGELDSDDPVADARAIYLLVASVAADQATLRGAATPREEIEHILVPFISRTIGLV